MADWALKTIYLSSSYYSKIGFTVHDARHLLSDEDWNKIKWSKPEKQNIQLYINLVIFVGSSKKTSTKANKIPIHATHSYITKQRLPAIEYGSKNVSGLHTLQTIMKIAGLLTRLGPLETVRFHFYWHFVQW